MCGFLISIAVWKYDYLGFLLQYPTAVSYVRRTMMSIFCRVCRRIVTLYLSRRRIKGMMGYYNVYVFTSTMSLSFLVLLLAIACARG